MSNTVVKNYHGEERAGTFLIAQGFQRDHFRLIELIKKHKIRFLKLEGNKHVLKEFIINKIPAKKAGRPIEEYLLNEAQTIFLGTLFRNSSDLILDFKMNLAREFVNLKKQNEALKKHKSSDTYRITRTAGKLVRKETTDEIQAFINYAMQQGGTESGCKHYYSNITKMMNSMLFIIEGKYKNLRAVMSIPQLMTTFSAEQIIGKGLKDGMANNIFYKDIYQSIKQNVRIFAEMHGQSEIINKQLSLFTEP